MGSNPIHVPASGNISSKQAAAASLCGVVVTAKAFNCNCNGECSATQAAQCLQYTALDVLSSPSQSLAMQSRLMKPLGTLVARQNSREGQEQCAAFVTALGASDYAAALDACAMLIEMANCATK